MSLLSIPSVILLPDKGQSKPPLTLPLQCAGDVVCVREEAVESDAEDELEFWLVTESCKKNNLSQLDSVPEAEVVASLLPLHHNYQLGKLSGLAVKVTDSGVVLLSEGDEEKGDGADAQRA